MTIAALILVVATAAVSLALTFLLSRILKANGIWDRTRDRKSRRVPRVRAVDLVFASAPVRPVWASTLHLALGAAACPAGLCLALTPIGRVGG